MNQKELFIGEILFISDKKTIQIYDTLYGGKPCYCVEHIPTHHKEIIDFDNRVIKSIIQKIKRTKAFVMDKKSNGYMFKFNKKGREGNISLRNYAYAKYHNLSLDNVRRNRIALRDDSARVNNILDLRQCNLYRMGGYRPEGISIVERLINPEEKYILTEYGGELAIQNYSPELYELLTTRNMCAIRFNKHNKRHNVIVHYEKNKNGYMILSLSRFVLLLNAYFVSYQNMKGGLKRFIHDIPLLSDKLGAVNDCGHVNACKWNNCAENIMPMNKNTNVKMRDYITHFVGKYNAFAIVQGGSVLVELTNSGERQYYKCNTPEEYCNLQLTLLGKVDLTKNLAIRLVNKTDSKVTEINTPLQEYEKAKCNENVDVMAEFWEWCNRRDEIINLYRKTPDIFKTWVAVDRGVSIDTMFNNILSFFTAPLLK